uniref:NADH-ubiquinone oxidoreductase chain 4L n=1 Tax=Stachyamoeba lipophora TaxID=463046 RepID=A0A0B5GSK3_STALP|nr:NADH dehydrogenase subunit 4L [Stachyamoeba lipophora]AJF22935.1 NADH dehydrogenase subunit 4L [Stachyamoeba lipophora]
MYSLLFNLSIFLFLIGLMGVFFGRKNIILIIISLELMLLAVTFHYLVLGWSVFGDMKSILLGMFLLSIGASESAIGLALAISYYKQIQ